MVEEVRSTGTQTIAPPSTHPSGEQITWQNELEIVRIDGDELLRLAGIVAAGALLARHWPRTNGIRNELAMALAGGLLRGGWSVAEAERFILAVCTAAGDEEARDRIQKARHTNNKLNSDRPTTGWKTLAGLMGRTVGANAREWPAARNATSGNLHLTDLGNSRRLVEKLGEDLRFIHPWKQWTYWSDAGTHWQRDQTGHAVRCGKEVVRGIYDEAA